jgi:glutamyl-tRNA synthetase
VRGRFAPSPTGRLHLGNARSALLGWLQARAAKGEFLLRIEDLDRDRCKSEHTDALLRDLEWLGLDWDGPVVKQSERSEAYLAALEQLARAGRTYLCTCSRADLVTAPHEGEEGPVYPGTCREGVTRPDRPASTRFRVEPGVVAFDDLLRGHCTQDVERQVGDFVLARADGVTTYQLAVVVDDAAAGVTHVLRGDDLLASTPRQIQLHRALGLSVPQYAHVPLLLGADGKRMAKRQGATTVEWYRRQDADSRRLVGLLAQWSGLGDGTPTTARELLSTFALERIRREPTAVRE